MEKNNAKLPDLETLIQAGIDPRTKLPVKLLSNECSLQKNIKTLLRIVDEQDAINRYVWYNLPDGLSGQLIERILYYKYKGMFFYMDNMKKFYFLPFALDGTIDVYGRFTGITPLPFNGSTSDEKNGKLKPWIPGMRRTPVYEVEIEEITRDKFNNSAVILTDYCKQISQTSIPRATLQESILDVESKMIPYLNTALMSATGIDGMRVSDEDQQTNVEEASRALEICALTGRKWVPIVGQQEFQEFNSHEVGKAEEFLMTMQSLDNFRLGLYGLDTGGIFQKKAHMLESENEMNSGKVGLVYQDGLTLRQEFCDIVNSIWGLNIYVAPSDTVVSVDGDFDGDNTDDQDQSGLFNGSQPEDKTGGEE